LIDKEALFRHNVVIFRKDREVTEYGFRGIRDITFGASNTQEVPNSPRSWCLKKVFRFMAV